jgi:beta-lactamase regulating signal transducer with metallopeptidase domain
MVRMKTTLEIPDQLFREAKAKAALEGVRLKDLVTEGLRTVLYGKPPLARKSRRIKFPVLESRGKAMLTIPDDAAYRVELMDDLARHEAALR